MWNLRGIKYIPTASEPITGALKIRSHLIVSDGPSGIDDMVTAVKINSVVGNASPSPDDGCTPQLPTRCHRHRCMQPWIQRGGFGELLDAGAELVITALDQQDIEAVLGCFKSNDDAGGTGPDHR
jgi:hypothetical protein